MKQKSAIIPFRIKKDKVEVLLVRNSSNTKWVIPKGTIPKYLSPDISAAKEAFEEAGVIGKILPIKIGTYKKLGEAVDTFVMKASLTLNNYDEIKYRDRKWANADKIDVLISDEDLKNLVLKAKNIIKSKSAYFNFLIDLFLKQKGFKIIEEEKKKVVFETALKNQICILREKSITHFKIVKNKNLQASKKELLYLLEANNSNASEFWSIETSKNGKKRLVWNLVTHIYYLSENVFNKIIYSLEEKTK